MTTPIDPGDTAALAPRDAKVLVSYWALDYLLDWVFHHSIHKGEDWSCETHYDQLRGEMEADTVPDDIVIVRRDDLRDVLAQLRETVYQLKAIAGEAAA